MKLLQKYFRQHALTPLILCITALSVLALLTHSLSTIELIIENRQSALTFLYITVLTLPKLLGVILPIAVFIAILYALNRLNVDSEMVVAKAAGYSPWQLASPALRVGVYALIAHLLINLFVQPYAQQEMRTALLDVSTDLASQLVRPGEFNVLTDGLTAYAAEVRSSGEMRDILIYDARQSETPTTYTAQTGLVGKSTGSPVLTMSEGHVQHVDQSGEVRIVGFDNYQFDLAEIMSIDQALSLKPSDQYLGELLLGSANNPRRDKYLNDYLSEGHARLSAPLYNIALVLIAVAFLVRGEFKRMGYGRKIALAAFLGFFVRLMGFVMASAAEGDASLNIYQYGIPVATISLCVLYMNGRSRKGSPPNFSKPKAFSDGLNNGAQNLSHQGVRAGS